MGMLVSGGIRLKYIKNGAWSVNCVKTDEHPTWIQITHPVPSLPSFWVLSTRFFLIPRAIFLFSG
jgi:hypothetical protein